MTGRLEYRRERGRSAVRWEQVEGVGLWTATLYEPEGLREWRLERRMRKLERELARQGVERVALPPGFPHKERLERVRPVETAHFLQSVADVLALEELRLAGLEACDCTVELAASRLRWEVRETARRLCPRVRRLRIRVPGEGEKFARLLQREWGMPVTPRSDMAQVTLAFDPECEREGRVIGLWEGGYAEGRLWYEGEEGSAVEGLQLLALLWERGALEREKLRVAERPCL